MTSLEISVTDFTLINLSVIALEYGLLYYSYIFWTLYKILCK